MVLQIAGGIVVGGIVLWWLMVVVNGWPVRRVATVGLLLFVAACLLAAAGCARPEPAWTRTGGTPDELRRDQYVCERDARLIYNGVKAAGLYRRCMEARGWASID